MWLINHSSFIFIISIIFVCFLPALIEELFFRGLITAGLNSENKFLSVIISGALFSIFHMAPNQTLYHLIFLFLSEGQVIPDFINVRSNLKCHTSGLSSFNSSFLSSSSLHWYPTWVQK